ncbi:hypothetical protein Tco_0412045 [Tanacetum coccineum]
MKTHWLMDKDKESRVMINHKEAHMGNQGLRLNCLESTPFPLTKEAQDHSLDASQAGYKERTIKALGTRLDMSTAYHPQTDGQSSIDKGKLKAARDHQKSYADNRSKSLEFEIGDQVLLKVSPWKGVIRFGKKGKLAPRYVGPFEILERVCPIAYRLRLPEELSSVHDTFHVSNLKKCLADANLHVPLDEIKVDKTFRFVEEPVEIIDREVKSLKRSKIFIVK